MAAPAFSKGEVLLALLVFSDGQGGKRRPVLVVSDFGDSDLLVVPITSHAARTQTDVFLNDWKNAGLKVPSTVRTEKFATIAKSCVVKKLGALPANDATRVSQSISLFANKSSGRQRHKAVHCSNASACFRAASVWPPNMRVNSVTRSFLFSKEISEIVRPSLTCLVTT
jgi:mRNA interferase MazF